MTRTEPLPYRLTAKLEHVEALDGAIPPLARFWRRLPKPVRDLLHGVPAGHPIHPVAVLVPTGAWLSAAVLDLLPGNRKAARRLVGVGVLSALPAVAAGWVDWSILRRDEQRVGLFHAAANASAVGLYGASWLLRRRGRQGAGVVLGLGGLALVSVAGYLGGHLTYRQGAGVVPLEGADAEPAGADAEGAEPVG